MRKSKQGFTLVELLVSSGLCALLLVGVLSVLVSISRGKAAMQQAQKEQSWPPQLFELMSWDLQQARSVQASANQVRIEGYSCLDPQSMAKSHRHVLVTYQLRSLEGKNLLVREQKHLDLLSNRNVWIEPICGGIKGFNLKAVAESTTRAINKDALPGRWELTLEPADAASSMQRLLLTR